jgi:3-hydroxyisobutyrate dehydrogenase-like beta-hydroxyacid dehydrogenase
MRIGWIGLGRVGQPMALRALGGGHSLTGHSRRFAQHAEVARAGGRLSASIAETVGDAELVCVNVYSEEQLRDALLVSGGLAAMASGSVLVIHSTVPPALIAELVALRPDIAVLDAGFSGTAEDTAVGGLTLMVGGDAEALARVEPVFRCYARAIVHLGPSGAGMTLKILNNLIFAAQMNLAREAIAVITQSGVALGPALDALQGGSAASYALGVYQHSQNPLARFDQARPYLEKDVAIALAAFPALRDLRDATRVYVA